MLRGALRAVALTVAMTGLGAVGVGFPSDDPSEPRVRVEVEPLRATVGDPLDVRLEVHLPPATGLEPRELGPTIGPFSVAEGIWDGPQPAEPGTRWVWSGKLVAFRTGELELPSIAITVEDEAGARRQAASEPVAVTIESVLEGAEGDPQGEELSDLKPPASMPADYGALRTAASILLALLAGSALLWWLHRRYAARLAAVPAPDDPFHRTPPHEWIYAELKKLLGQRLNEADQVARFFAEIARILKRYLEGRFRVELMERTTSEVPQQLRQAGAGEEAISEVRRLLERCDLVKFAAEPARADERRAAIEAAYRIVDATKPRTEAAPRERGAA